MVIWQNTLFSYIYKNKVCVLHNLSIWHHKVDIILVTLCWQASQLHWHYNNFMTTNFRSIPKCISREQRCINRYTKESTKGNIYLIKAPMFNISILLFICTDGYWHTSAIKFILNFIVNLIKHCHLFLHFFLYILLS